MPPLSSPDVPLPPAPNLATRLTMLAGGIIVTIALVGVTAVLPKIEAALAHTDNDKLLVKMIVPIIGFTMVIGAPLTGFLIDRLGLRKILVVHSLIYGVAGTAGLYLSSLPALLVSRLFVGMAAAGIATISMTLINTRLDGIARARWMGFHISTAMIASLFINPALGFLGELGWRWPFIIYAAGFFVTILTLFGLKAEGPAKAASAAAAPRQHDRLLSWFPLRFIPLALVLGSVTYLPMVYLPYVMREAGITSPATISMVMLADAMLGAMMSLMFGRSQRYISSQTAFIISFACTGTGMLVVALAPNFVTIVIGMMIFGLGIGWFVPNLMTSVSRCIAEHQQGRAVGIVKAAHYVASPLAVIAVEPIARSFGPAGVLLTGSVLSFGVLALFACRLSGRLGRDAKLKAGGAAV